MMFKALAIGAVILAVLFIGLPYYQAYKRRKELARREQQEQKPPADKTPPGS